MNSTHPTECLTREETDRIRALVASRGEREAVIVLGKLNRATFYKAAAGFPVARLTVQVIRYSLDRI